MTERPIPFSTEMVKAILEGRKIQTRRVCRDQSALEYRYVKDIKTYPEFWKGKESPVYTGWVSIHSGLGIGIPRTCPYGTIGDHLWVKETARLRYIAPNDGEIQLTYKDGTVLDFIVKHGEKNPYRFNGWTSGRYMPRWASRITLEITDVRADRLQAISEDDVLAEGLTWNEWMIAKDRIAKDNLNAKRGFGWDANPYVWVISFKVLS